MIKFNTSKLPVTKRFYIYNGAVSILNLEYISLKSVYFAGPGGLSVVQSCCWSHWVPDGVWAANKDMRGSGHFNNKLIIY